MAVTVQDLVTQQRVRASRAAAIAGQITDMIDVGQLRSGERLPSVRQAARQHGVSKNTMAEAYGRLVASGLVEGRVGAGYFVTRAARPRSLRPRPDVAEALDLVSLLREQLEQHYDVRPGDGRQPRAWMEGSRLAPHLASAKASGTGRTIDQ